MRAVSRIDIHQDNPCQRASELEHRPLHAVGGPDACAVAGNKTEGPHSGRGPQRFVRVLLPGEPHLLMAGYQCEVVWETGRGRQEELADRRPHDSAPRSARVTFHVAILPRWGMR